MKSQNYLDLQQIRSLIAILDSAGGLQTLVQRAQRSYELCLKIDQRWDVLSLAVKLDQRESWKMVLKEGKKEEKTSEHWKFGELQIFTCIILIYCHSKNTALTQLIEEDYQNIKSIFHHKSIEFIKYEIARIVHSKQIKSKREWQEQEIAIVRRIIGEERNNIDWRMVSFQLFKESKGKYVRCQKDCREKWKNYLNPHIKKGHWTQEEDKKLEGLIAKYGTKWSLIAKHFKEERTEHMVKNRYNSLSRASKKKSKRNKKSKKNKSKKSEVIEMSEEYISEISAIMEQAVEDEPIEEQANFDQIDLISQSSQPIAKVPESKDVEMSFKYFQGSNFFQKKIISNSHSIYDSFLKRTSDQDDDQDNQNQFKICLESNPLWAMGRGLKEQNGFDSIFSLEGEVKKNAMDEIVSALGCTHYERIFSSWEEEPASHFQWID